MIISVSQGDETVSIGEAKEGGDKVALVVQRAGEEAPQRAVIGVASLAALGAMIAMYMGQFEPVETDEEEV